MEDKEIVLSQIDAYIAKIQSYYMQSKMTNDMLVIQLTHQKALKLLLDLEELNLIRVLKKNVQSEQKLSDKYAGKLSADIGQQLQQHITQSRNEWERNI